MFICYADTKLILTAYDTNVHLFVDTQVQNLSQHNRNTIPPNMHEIRNEPKTAFAANIPTSRAPKNKIISRNYNLKSLFKHFKPKNSKRILTSSNGIYVMWTTCAVSKVDFPLPIYFEG